MAHFARIGQVLERAHRFADFGEGDLCRELLFLSTLDNEVLRDGDVLEKDGEANGVEKQCGAKVEEIKASVGGDSGLEKLREEFKEVAIAVPTKDALFDDSQEMKQTLVDKKIGKQGKSSGKPIVGRKFGDLQPFDELRFKEEAETNRKVHESLDNFIRQTIRCEPYMSFTNRPGDKPLHRLRPDVFENHVAGKFVQGFKGDNGSVSKAVATEENYSMDSNLSDLDGMKDASNSTTKGIAGLGKGVQHSLKIPPGVFAFNQNAVKATNLQGWLSPSKTKCEKCTREFCSTLNYRRHVRVHRRSLNTEKEDLSKERSKVAAFWDKLTPEDAGSIVHYQNMDIEDLSGRSALDALKVCIQHPGLASLPQGILKAGSLLLDIVQNKVSLPLSSERLLAILDDASEKTFLCGGTSIAVQRFVFNGEAGKVGLEDKNLVASLGFHIELKLVKAWMADKEAEALRCQQALFKEEEDAQQRRQNLLKKKRMKKIRQKERKGSTSQLILQELDNESVDDEGNVQGICEEDDSPTGMGSSSSSLASVQDLGRPELAEVDEANVTPVADVMVKPKLVLEQELNKEKNLLSNENQRDHSLDELLQVGNDVGESPYRTEKPSAGKSILEVGASSHPRLADQVGWDGYLDSRSAYSLSQSSSRRTREVHSNLYLPKVEQDRIEPELKRCELSRLAQEQKLFKITSDRFPSDYSDQKPVRDSMGFETRYGDSHQTAFKPLRKVNTYFVKGDSNNADFSSNCRSQHYRGKPPGMNRAPSSSGNGQVVWTRKVPQSVFFEAIKDNQDPIRGATESSRVNGWAGSKALQLLSVPNFAKGDVATRINKERTEKKEDEVTPVSLDVSSGNVTTTPTNCSSVSFHIDVDSEDWPRLPQRFGSTYCCDTSLLAKSASFDSVTPVIMEEDVESVLQLFEGESKSVFGSCSHDPSGLMKTTLASVQLQDSRLAGVGDDVISVKELQEVDEEILNGALLVGSLSVPLGKFATVCVSQAKFGRSAQYLHHPDDLEVSYLHVDGSHGESNRLSGGVVPELEVGSSSQIYAGLGSSDGTHPTEKSLDSSLRSSGTRSWSRSNASTTQPVKLKPFFVSSSPEGRESCRYGASLLGHERLAVKQGSWQTSAGRYVTAKVWRAVGIVGERQDFSLSGLQAASGGSPSSFLEASLSQDVDASGRSGCGREISHKADVRHGSPAHEDEFLTAGLQDRNHFIDDHCVVMNFDTREASDDQSILSGPSVPLSSVSTDSGTFPEGKGDSNYKGDETSISASGLCTLSVYVEVAGTFFDERWKEALSHASVDEVLLINAEGISREAERLNFMEMVLQQMSKQSSMHQTNTETGPSLSSFLVSDLSGRPAKDDVFFSRICNDSDMGVENGICPLTTLEGLDGDVPQVPSLDGDDGVRDASTSLVRNEEDLSGNESASSAALASGGGGADGSFHARNWNGRRQERWYRNSQDRFFEQ